MESNKEKKEDFSKKEKSSKSKSVKKVKTIKNNSAFKRAVTQMDMKSGDKITVTFDDGSRYKVECL